MVNIAICDDDFHFRESLADTVKATLPSPFSISLYGDGADLLRGMEREQGHDLVLLDIRMPRMNGLETARRIRELDTGAVVILITNYGEYVYEGYDVRAFHFLTKPLDEARLLTVLTSAVREIKKRRTDFLAVKTANECRYIPLADIRYIESCARKKAVHAVGETLEFYGNMAALSTRLEPKGFCRIHRCCLVNLEHVRRVDTDGYWVHLKDGGKLEASRRRLAPLLDALLGGL